MATNAATRLTIRIRPHVREKLQMAADLQGATPNQFLVQAAMEKAERVIENESRILLTRRESLRLLELIENPPPRNEKLKSLMADYGKSRTDD